MTDSTDPEIVPDAPIPADEPDQPVDVVEFEPSLVVVRQGEWRIVNQERTAGDVQTIILDPQQRQAVGWALLNADDATSDVAAAVDPNAVNEGGRFE